jgi:hypothetical protein
MAHSAALPASQQTPKAHFDWYTFLRNAFLNGLKAYGASLMTVGVPEPSAPCLPASKTWETNPTSAGAPGPSPLGTGESCSTKPKSAESELKSLPALPTPALCPIHRAASRRDGWETMNSVLDWTRA